MKTLMQKLNFHLLSDFIGESLSNDTISTVLFKLDDTYKFIVDNNLESEIKIYLNLRNIELLHDLDIYEAKLILSNFTDTNKVFVNEKDLPPNNQYIYYKVGILPANHFEQILDYELINLFESVNNINTVAKFVSENKYPITLLKINLIDKLEIPKLSSVDPVHPCTLLNEIFFETNIKPEFENDYPSYRAFKSKFYEFYRSFNWDTWKPLENPFPAHHVLDDLRKCHTSNKEDAYLLKWGKIMAFVNGARFNKLLTQLNEDNRNVNDVFQIGKSKGNQILFISIDTESGPLEMYDSSGVHLNYIYGLQTGIKPQKRPYKINVPKSKWLV